MAPLLHSALPRASVCLTCGDKGDTKHLIYCRNCRDSTVHYYCLAHFSPADVNINWWCWGCEPKDTNAESSRKSARISTKKQKVRETRNYLREKLKQRKRQVQISKISERGRLAIAGHLSIQNMETKLVNETGRDQDDLEKKLIPENRRYSEEHNESIKIDEPTFATKSTLRHKQENNMESFDETQKIQEFGQKKIAMLLKESVNAQNEGKTIDLQLPSLVANDHCATSDDKLCKQPSLEPDDCLSAEPVTAPIWRGWFNIEEVSETCLQILAHLSDKACSKVSDAATAMPPMLDIQLLDKHVMWPKAFRTAPPTAASICLYFFPASERDERVYDSLVDEVIERDLALKVVINDIELLIFSSRELPLEHWRYNSKYYLWGMLKKQRLHLSTESATSTKRNSSTQFPGLSQRAVEANNIDLVHSQNADHLSPPSQPSQSPLTMKTSQASNVFSSKHNSPDSLACLSFELNKLDKTVEVYNWQLQKKFQSEEQNFKGKSQAHKLIQDR